MDPTISIPLGVVLFSLLPRFPPVSDVSLVNSCYPFHPASHSSAHHPPVKSVTKSRDNNQRKSRLFPFPLSNILWCCTGMTALTTSPPSPSCLLCPSLLGCLPEARLCINSLLSSAFNFRSGINSSGSLLASLSLTSSDRHRFLKSANAFPHLPSLSSSDMTNNTLL